MTAATIDNGVPSFGAWGPDQVSGTLIYGEDWDESLPADFPASCPDAAGDLFASQYLHDIIGNIVVH